MSSSCQFCSKLLKSDRGFRNHIYKMHNDKYASLQPLTYQCAICVMSFNSASALSAHKKSHVNNLHSIISSKDEEIAALKQKLSHYEKYEELKNVALKESELDKKMDSFLETTRELIRGKTTEEIDDIYHATKEVNHGIRREMIIELTKKFETMAY